MKNDPKKTGRSKLRMRVERQMKNMPADVEATKGVSASDMAKTIHELRVHQIELRMQNEELRRIHEELEAARDRYSNLYDFAPVGYLTIDKRGSIVEANLTFATLMGMERSAFVGRPLSRFIQRKDQDVYYLRHKYLMESGNLQSFRITLVRNDGSEFDANFECMLVSHSDSKRKHCRIIVSNITEQKKLEWQQQQAQKMEAVAKLAGGIAHQFNNELSVIVGTIDMLELDVPKDENTSQYIASIRRSAERMEHLTTQLLAYARKGNYEGSIISLSDFVRNTLPLLEHTLDPSIVVETSLPDVILKTKGDASQFLMVLSAVLSNAAEAIEGLGRINIACRNELITQKDAAAVPGLFPGPYVSLTIEDSGRGMDEATRKRVFEPFFTTKGVGRGLGLAAVYGIVKNYGGWISVESQVDQGTRVCIYLPAVPLAGSKKSGSSD
ncbi:nitrogen regulation protein NR(II) [Desulfosarcina sp.]|uniref:two-component system sensor histidine kinase NtrB n=1 Tax=Desulfosarcina sp. TaxID=2027861 RepID=UPI00356251B7